VLKDFETVEPVANGSGNVNSCAAAVGPRATAFRRSFPDAVWRWTTRTWSCRCWRTTTTARCSRESTASAPSGPADRCSGRKSESSETTTTKNRLAKRASKRTSQSVQNAVSPEMLCLDNDLHGNKVFEKTVGSVLRALNSRLRLITGLGFVSYEIFL